MIVINDECKHESTDPIIFYDTVTMVLEETLGLLYQSTTVEAVGMRLVL